MTKQEINEIEVLGDITIGNAKMQCDDPEDREEEIGNNQGDPSEEEEPPGGN